MTDITFLDAGDLTAKINSGALSAHTLMSETLDRIDAVNPTVNAVVSRLPAKDLLAQAHAADQVPLHERGPLHGLPIAVKDLANAKGLPTSLGSPLFAGTMPPKDDEMVARMRAAGAIVIGKTNTPEFGLGSHSYNPVFGVTSNPYGTDRSAGGSSGGAGAALATGMIAVADGSDMMGSLRNPAAWNNVYGLRPTYGRVPLDMPGDAFLHQLAVAGPMGRSPRDVALLLDVQSGLTLAEPHSFAHTPCLPQIDGSVAGLKIGWLGDWDGAYPMQRGVLDTCNSALAEFAKLGIDVEPVPAPFDATSIWQSWVTLRAWANAGGKKALYDNPDMRKGLKPEAIWEIETGLKLSAMDVHAASLIRSQWYSALNKLFEHYDALLLPSAQMWPFPKDWDWPKDIEGHPMDTYHRWMEVVVPVSLVGVPCLSIPAGFNPDGLPMGMQLFGPRYSDAKLLKIGQRWHETTPFAGHRPDVNALSG